MGEIMPDWFLYLIRVKNGSLYTGVTTDVERRFQEHADGGGKAAKYFRGKGPLRLVFCQKVGDRSLAMKAEAAVKKLSKSEKEDLVGGVIKLKAILTDL